MSDNRTGGRWIFRRYIVKDGRRIYPKNGKCFCFWVNDAEDPSQEQEPEQK